MTDALIYEKIQPWQTLSPEEFTVEADRLGGNEMARLYRLLRDRGIAVLRLQGTSPEPEILEALIDSLGTVSPGQNRFGGKIKDISPKAGEAANSGDSSGELGPHVDGTQVDVPPEILIFQYVYGAKYGAQSQFWDLAHVLHSLPAPERHRMLVNLARPDAATFEKRGARHEGSIVEPGHRYSVRFRIRFDDVIRVHAECQADFNFLKAKFSERSLEFLPQAGDIVIFDNTRLLHGRREVRGNLPRLHRRVWIEELFPELRREVYLGVRGLELETLVEIRRQHESTRRKRSDDAHRGPGGEARRDHHQKVQGL